MDFFEIMLQQKLAGGGSDVKVNSLSVTENGTYTALPGHAFSPVNVSVPVGVFPSGTSSITANGIYDITSFASVDVNVSSGGGGDHDAEDGIITKSISGTYTNSRVTSIGSSAFQYCSALTEISFPNTSYIGNYAFQSCSALTKISFPNTSSIGSSAFQYCSALTEISFPNTSYIGSYAFASCSNLTNISLSAVTKIYGNAFYNCRSLMSIYLLGSSVPTLSNASTFYSTPMFDSTYTGSFGSIYVPASLVDAYKSATYWSTYSSRITAYEG